MKEELTRKLIQRVNQVIKTGLNSRNTVKAINTYAVPTLMYSFGIVKWSDTELQSLERKIRTMLTKNRMLHPKAAIERQVLPRMQGDRGITSVVWTHEKQINTWKKTDGDGEIRCCTADTRVYFKRKESINQCRYFGRRTATCTRKPRALLWPYRVR